MPQTLDDLSKEQRRDIRRQNREASREFWKGMFGFSTEHNESSEGRPVTHYRAAGGDEFPWFGLLMMILMLFLAIGLPYLAAMVKLHGWGFFVFWD